MSATSGFEFPHFHQVAIYAQDHDRARAGLEAIGFCNWIEDKALLVGTLSDGSESIIESRMSFCYGIIPERELEIVTYKGETHHHRSNMIVRMAGIPFLSHLSAHVSDLDEAKARIEHSLRDMCVDIVHEFETFNHTNPRIAGKKRFREVIYRTRHLYGYDTKLIQRLTEGPWTYPF